MHILIETSGYLHLGAKRPCPVPAYGVGDPSSAKLIPTIGAFLYAFHAPHGNENGADDKKEK